MSSRLGKAEGRAHSALADRLAAVERLATRCLDLSHQLRDFRDEHAGFLDPDDFDYLTELGVELAAYSAVLSMSDERRIDWLQHAVELAEKALCRVHNKQGGDS